LSEKNEPGNFRGTDKIDTFDSIKTQTMKRAFFLLSVILLSGVFACNQKPVQTPEEPEAVAAPVVEKEKMIIARVFIKPGLEETFIQEAKWIIDHTHNEEGCLEYTLYQDPVNKSNFFFFERYKDQAAIDVHFGAPYFKEFGEKAGAWIREPTEIKIYDITENK
jgi:quinol monooxygenase YgiN